MEYRKLGRTDIEVSTVAMGCWGLAGDQTWGAQDESDSIATVHAALGAGVNFFDTAEAYGDGYTEEVLGRALVGRRHEAVIASKVSAEHLSRDELRKACERSLRRLGVDTIDLYQIHWPSRTVPFSESMETLAEQRAEGKIRAIAISNFGLGDLPDLLQVERCESNQLPYSLLARAIEAGIQQMCVQEGIGILCYSPLAQGLLTGKFTSADEVPDGRARTRHFSTDRPQTRHGEAGCERETFEAIAKIRQISARLGEPMARVATAWLLQQPGVTSVIAGARHPDQIVENAGAADLALAPGVVAELSQATETVKQMLGPDPDLWQPRASSRYR